MYKLYKRYQTKHCGNSQNERNLAGKQNRKADKRCVICHQDVTIRQDFYHWLKYDSLICGDCQRQLHPLKTTCFCDDLQIYILYEYNDFLENLLFQYKEGKDVALRDCFFHEYAHHIEKRYRGYTMVFMPSGIEKTSERGFYALREMLKEIRLPKIELFYKSENWKQSALSYQKRQEIYRILHLRKDVKIPQTKLLLIDDVCTTGATLLRAYQLLAGHDRDIKACVLCANPLFLEKTKTADYRSRRR